MIQLELVGCTGAGKSTLAKRMVDFADLQGIGLATGDMIALTHLGLGRLKSGRLRSPLVHSMATWGLLNSRGCHTPFVQFAKQVLKQTKIPRVQQWNQLRKVLKQLGRYEALRKIQSPGQVALVDEGTIHSAHNLFVHMDHAANDEQLDQFACQVPLPELFIYLREREDVLVERTLERGHPRIASLTTRSVSGFVRQAVRAFDQLAKHPRISTRMVVVEGQAIVSQPPQAMSTPTKNILDVLRGAIETPVTHADSHDLEPTSIAHSGVA